MIDNQEKIAVEPGYYQFLNNEWLFSKDDVPVPKNYNYTYITKPTKILLENGKIMTTVVLSQEELSTLNIKTPCNHEYVDYQGLKETFQFCKKCDEIK